MRPRAGGGGPGRQAAGGKSPRRGRATAAATAPEDQLLSRLSSDIVRAAVECGTLDYVGLSCADFPDVVLDQDWDDEAEAGEEQPRSARREKAAGSSTSPRKDPVAQRAVSGPDVAAKDAAAPVPPPGPPPAHASRRPGGHAPGSARARPQLAAAQPTPPEPKPPAEPREGLPAPAPRRRRKNRRSPAARPAASAGPPAGERAAAPPPGPPQKLPPVNNPTRSFMNWGRPEDHQPCTKEQEEKERAHWEWWCIPGLRSYREPATEQAWISTGPEAPPRDIPVRPGLCRPNLDMYKTGQAWPKPDMSEADTFRRTAPRSPRARGAARSLGPAKAATGRLPPLHSARQAPTRRNLEEVEADLEMWKQRMAESALEYARACDVPPSALRNA